MALTTGPLHCLAAAGTLIPGLTFRRRGGRTIIERTPYHAIKPTQASIANQSIIKCLTAWWHLTSDPASFGWNLAVPTYGKTPYHAFLAVNLRQIWDGGAPTNTYPPPTLPSPGNITSVSHYITQNHVKFGYYSNSSNPRWVDIAWRTQVVPLVRSPHTLAAIWLVRPDVPYGYRLHDDVHIPAGVWHYFFTSVRTNYSFYAGLAWRSLTIPG